MGVNQRLSIKAKLLVMQELWKLLRCITSLQMVSSFHWPKTEPSMGFISICFEHLSTCMKNFSPISIKTKADPEHENKICLDCHLKPHRLTSQDIRDHLMMHTHSTRVAWIASIRKCMEMLRFTDQRQICLLTEGSQSYNVPDSQSSSVCCNYSTQGSAWRNRANRGVDLSELPLLAVQLFLIRRNRNTAFPPVQVVEASHRLWSLRAKNKKKQFSETNLSHLTQLYWSFQC